MSPRYSLPSFESNVLSVHFGFPIDMSFAFLDLHDTLVHHTVFKSSGLSVQDKKLKIDFQDSGYCGHLGFLILAGFDVSRQNISYLVSSQ